MGVVTPAVTHRLLLGEVDTPPVGRGGQSPEYQLPSADCQSQNIHGQNPVIGEQEWNGKLIRPDTGHSDSSTVFSGRMNFVSSLFLSIFCLLPIHDVKTD